MTRITWRQSAEGWRGTAGQSGVRYSIEGEEAAWWVKQDAAWMLGPFLDRADAMRAAEFHEEGADLAMAASKPGAGEPPSGLWRVRAINKTEERITAIVRAPSEADALDRFREACGRRGPFTQIKTEPLSQNALVG
jgi:hypothetical protein